MGVSLTDTTDEAKAAFKEKLQKVSQKVSKESQQTPNNPNTASSTPSQAQLLERVRYGDKQAKTEAISGLEAVKQMKAMAGYQDPR